MKSRLFALLVMGVATSVLHAAPPAPSELRAEAERCERILRASLVQFYLPHCLDREFGGYLEHLRDGKFVHGGEKFLTLQARHLWFFSTLATEGIERDAALEAARHGYRFIQDKFRDPVHGGYFSKVTDAGELKDPRKHAYLNSFALYGLVAYANAAKDRDALKAAQFLFQLLDQRAYDQKHGGYIEFFERDWTEVTDPRAQGYVGAIGHKTYNTHLHLLESFAELQRAAPNPKAAERLQELLAINISTVRYPAVNNNVDAFHRDWSMVMTPRNLRASYGHDVECVWLVLDAADTLRIPRPTLRSWAQALVDTSMRFGYDEQHGGFFESGPLGEPADAKKKTWWVQTEALLGLLDTYRLTRDEKYYAAFLQTLNFCEKHQVAKEGGWWATRAADGSPTSDLTRTGPWQGAYHAARALIYSSRWLKELAQEAENSQKR